jgi:hypothetical protein
VGARVGGARCARGVGWDGRTEGSGMGGDGDWRGSGMGALGFGDYLGAACQWLNGATPCYAQKRGKIN